MNIKKMLLVMCFTSMSTSAFAQTFSTICGSQEFVVEKSESKELLTHKLFYLDKKENKSLIYTSQEGNWFHAKCVEDKFLVFQTYCPGSSCVETNYGVFDGLNKKLLLLPSNNNVSNEEKAKKILKQQAPYLPDDSSAFCCEK